MTTVIEFLSIIGISILIVSVFMAFLASMRFATNKLYDLINTVRYLDIPAIVQLYKHIGIRT